MNCRIYRAILLAGIALFSACAKGKIELRYEYPAEAAVPVSYPDVSFAVISDLHIYDPSLGASGAAFEKTMNSDRKLLLDSRDLLDYAIEAVIGSEAGFVLISGDLTKDGELINHRLAAEKLKSFTNAGIAVYIVPGNHDINNPNAVSFFEDTVSPVPKLSEEGFADIYGDFGFNAALMRDDDSLSYVVEPVDGLWLLGIDACRYRENIPGQEEIVSGKISQKTADWIAGVLLAAAEENKAVMVLMHHGVVEHWKGQAKLHPDYLINDYGNFGEFLASWNVRLAFTGHYHAQDITLASFGGKFIYDIETGSLVTAPCPIRYAEIKDNVIQIRTETIADKLHPFTDFALNARAFVKKTVMFETLDVLKKYKVSGKNADYIADAVGDAFDAHYAGDEDPALRPAFDKSKLNLWGRFIYGRQKYVLDGLWNDLPPGDNNIRLEL
ncbi:MAG: metallophosphoesterase [Treponema sp.]|jgi:3',5'-cyclic AMP phosphodiesterase CpdA|nr:metallophosphoesterase [Treponema sp.]